MKTKLWYLYDFANSFASSVIIFYLPLIISDLGYSDIWISAAAVVSTLFLIVFYPKLGHIADQDSKFKFNAIKISSFVMVVSLVLLAFFTENLSDNKLLSIVLISALYIIFQVAFQGSYIFYTSYLQDFKNENKDKESVSNFGMGIGQLGNAMSVGLMGGLVIGSGFSLFGLEDKGLAFFLGALFFTILSIPFLTQKLNFNTANKNIKSFSYLEFVSCIKKSKKLSYFLLGYLLVSDSVFTLQLYLSLYMKEVFKFTDKETSLALGVSLISLFLTCTIFGLYSKNIKNKEKSLLIGGGIYVFAFCAFAFLKGSFTFIVFIFIFLGLAYGLFFPLARSMYSDMIPKDEQAKFFSSFIIFERAATIIGPIIWIVVSYLLIGNGIETIYRSNVFMIGLTSFIGILLIRKSFKFK